MKLYKCKQIIDINNIGTYLSTSLNKILMKNKMIAKFKYRMKNYNKKMKY